MSPTYALHSLGWKGFQDLCTTITREIWGQTVQVFFDSHDGGRDGAFQGKWKRREGESFRGSFTVQCKFTSIANKGCSLADLADELAKARQLAAAGLATNYILMTNARLTGSAEAKIRAAFLQIPKLQRFAAYGSDWIAQTIHESARLRMLVPRIYGLGDLSQIMDDRAYAQAEEILSSLGDDLAKFVITDAFKRSARAIVDHGFVLLLGQPASGKSTIAAALSVGALDNWKCSTVKVRDADDFVRHSNPHEPKQFFWVDDAFGATQLDWGCVSAWNRAFAHMKAAIRRGARVVFTSRDYVYRAARKHLKESGFPLIRESQVVIDVERLQIAEKEQILYNHIRLGTQPQEFRRRIKPYLPGVAASGGFVPEIARRLGDPLFTNGLSFSTLGLADFVERPVELLMDVIRNLHIAARSALTLVFMRAGTLHSPIQLTANETQALELLGSNLASVRESLNELEGSLTLRTLESGSYFWRFKHPTIRDALGALIAEDAELVDIYLSGTLLNTLLYEVSCGNVGISGVKVVVPQDRYDAMIARLDTIDTTKWEGARALHQFLSYRTDIHFLRRYLDLHSGFINNLRVGSYLSVVSDVDLLLRLEESHLLPEDKRKKVVATIRDLAISTPDSDFLADRFRCIFRGKERAQIFRDVREKLIPNLSQEIWNWRGNIEADDDPESYFDSFTSALRTYRRAFKRERDITSKIDEALAQIEGVIDDLKYERQSSDDDDLSYAEAALNSEQRSTRSIFDDVDE